jgi:hypothetical protein
MKKVLAFALLFVRVMALGQTIPADPKFAPSELKTDLAYLKSQLYTVHVYPYTELNKNQYDRLFAGIEDSLTDSLTAAEFLKLIKPAIAYLCDEHAQAYLPEKLLPETYQKDAIFLPLILSRQGKVYHVKKVLSTASGLQPGEIITGIDGLAIDTLLKKCALFTSGYPDQRSEKALLQFGYLYSWTLPGIKHSFIITTNKSRTTNLQGVPLQVWKEELNKQTGWDSACDEKISYQKINGAGYINACSFNIAPKQLDSIGSKINNIFNQVKRDNPRYLFIDISKNSGGQSVVGEMLLNGFNGKPYRSFSHNFKKSEDYVKLLKSWGVAADDYYKNAPEGKVFHFDSDTTFPAASKPNRFMGKVFIIVGNGTFSSAMMMATWIKDNHLATIVGEMPVMGHPNGFGELYNTKLPNTKINILFGVKQWIRPSGDVKDNLLMPDLPVKLTDNKAELIKSILNKAG